jgi:hypothetical protein
MPRTLDIICPAQTTAELEAQIRSLDGILTLRSLRGASLQPPGDLITATISNQNLSGLMHLLDRHGLGRDGGVSVNSSEPDSVICSGASCRIDRDSNEAVWEEMEMIISKDSNANLATLLLMAIAGALATVGLVTNALHLVIGGMLVAPGFMPIIRIPLGIVARHEGWHRGITDTLRAYASLVAAAALTALLLRAIGYNIPEGSTTYHTVHQKLLDYWSTVTGSGLLASAGAILLATKRSIFTSGVMIGLALVPTMAIVGIATAGADATLAARALLRFGLDVLLILFIPLGYFLFERRRYHRRNSRL